jgi:hypothetical protein
LRACRANLRRPPAATVTDSRFGRMSDARLMRDRDASRCRPSCARRGGGAGRTESRRNGRCPCAGRRRAADTGRPPETGDRRPADDRDSSEGQHEQDHGNDERQRRDHHVHVGSALSCVCIGFGMRAPLDRGEAFASSARRFLWHGPRLPLRRRSCHGCRCRCGRAANTHATAPPRCRAGVQRGSGERRAGRIAPVSANVPAPGPSGSRFDQPAADCVARQVHAVA